MGTWKMVPTTVIGNNSNDKQVCVYNPFMHFSDLEALLSGRVAHISRHHFVAFTLVGARKPFCCMMLTNTSHKVETGEIQPN